MKDSPQIKINLTPSEDQNTQNNDPARILPQRPKKKINLKKAIIALIVVGVVFLTVFSSSIVFSNESLIKNIAKLNLIEEVGKLMGSKYKNLAGESSDRINFLIIGTGGRNHDGGTLADTIILASYKPSTQQVAMMSLPRDLSIASRYGQVKINAVHAYAEAKKKGSGGEIMIQTINQLLDTEVHYYAVIDFAGFEKIIDEFGGVDVYVDRDLIDPQYPIRGKEFVYPLENRYETLKIETGWQHMDGSLALKYARSRHGLGIEGSDFARSQRQQKIIMALKEKIFTLDTLLHPKRINSLLQAYNEHIQTNLEMWEILKLAQHSKDIDGSKIITQKLSDAPDGMLYATNINRAYVLLPQDGDFTEIKNVWQYIFYKEANNLTVTPPPANAPAKIPEVATPPAPPATVVDYQAEEAKIEIQNGTWIAGYAGKEKQKLTDLGFNITQAVNALKQDYATTVIYQLNNKIFTATAKKLEDIYSTSVANPAPVTIDSTADFVIILGQQ